MPRAAPPLVMVSANQAWNLVNFRAGLIRALIARGYAVLAVAPPDSVWEARLAEMGCGFAPLPVDSSGLSPWRDLATLRAIDRLMRRHRPVAWLSWTIKPNCYGALAARRRGVVALPNVSGLGTVFIRPSLVTAIAQGLYRLAFQRCPAVFFQNGDDRDLFVARRLVRPEQARLLPGSGVDLARFAVPEGGRPGRGRFLMIARLLADKGVREYVAAARRVRAELPDARFTIVGAVDADNRTAIPRAELDGWLSEGVIDWVPPVDDVRPLIAAADWIVLPSYREGASRVLIEATAMGRPVVTTDVPGCRDLVTDGENGLVCGPRDAVALAAALARAAAMPDAAWHAMARRGRARAERDHDEALVAARYFEVLARAGVNSGADARDTAGCASHAADHPIDNGV